jgi:phosphoglycolate phosphatase-like HAD superfamily hydrolase
MQNQAKNIKAVIFHLEGTLIEPYGDDANTITTPALTSDAEAMLGYLRSKDIRLALISRSSPASVQKMLAQVSDISISDFDTVISCKQQQARGQDINAVAQALKKMKLPEYHVLVVAANPTILQDAHCVFEPVGTV